MSGEERSLVVGGLDGVMGLENWGNGILDKGASPLVPSKVIA